MRILEIITDTNIGGAGVLLLNRLRYTDAKKYKTTVIIPRGSKLAARLVRESVDYIESSTAPDRSFCARDIFEYAKLIRRLKPELVNCHGALSARIAAKLCGVPVKLCTRHCVFQSSRIGRMLRRPIFWMSARLSDRYIAVAYAVRDDLVLSGVCERRICVIINGAQELLPPSEDKRRGERLRLGIPEDACVLSFNARLEAYKGHDWFLIALSELVRRGERVYALLLGDGSERERIGERIRELELDERVRMLGFVDDVALYMGIADINVNCSYGTETSSLALSEGMSLGLPCVVSDFGGNPYMVEDGVNGFVCRCFDAVGFADAVRRLICDRELYRKMSRNARGRFDRELNAREMTAKTNRLYDSLLEDASKSR